ncbi:hypothetical protein, partial [Variovorax paradoxus]|uniref:hypothetical protein n=1 Tax=Variovorax paradoxus TaxID=34073 RepID=UPI001E4C5F5B
QCVRSPWPGWSSLGGHKWGTLGGRRGPREVLLRFIEALIQGDARFVTRDRPETLAGLDIEKHNVQLLVLIESELKTGGCAAAQ